MPMSVQWPGEPAPEEPEAKAAEELEEEQEPGEAEAVAQLEDGPKGNEVEEAPEDTGSQKRPKRQPRAKSGKK